MRSDRKTTYWGGALRKRTRWARDFQGIRHNRSEAEGGQKDAKGLFLAPWAIFIFVRMRCLPDFAKPARTGKRIRTSATRTRSESDFRRTEKQNTAI